MYIFDVRIAKCDGYCGHRVSVRVDAIEHEIRPVELQHLQKFHMSMLIPNGHIAQ